MERIERDGTLLACVVRAGEDADRTTFLTPPELELQLGFVVYGAGGAVAAHRHVPVQRSLDRTLEVLLVRSGAADLDVFDEAGEPVATTPVGAGDLVLLVAGGHGLRFREPTVLLEIKQGPYGGLSEKELLPPR